MSAPGHGKKAIVAAFTANLGIAIAKFVGFLFTKSSSMLAESVHSFADTGNQGLLLFGARRSSRAPDTDHQFGYGSERYFWAFVVALVLFLGGATFAMYEGVSKIRHPHELEAAGWAIAILLLAVVLEGFSLRTAIGEANESRGNRSIWQFIRQSRAPELPVVMLEDLGALAGLLLALAGVVLSLVTGNAVFDGIATLLIGLLLAVIALVLAVEMKSLLLGESALPEEQEAIAKALVDGQDVRSVIHLRTVHIGPDELLLATKLEFDERLSLAELARSIDAAEQRVRVAVPTTKLIFIEPDLRRSVHG